MAVGDTSVRPQQGTTVLQTTGGNVDEDALLLRGSSPSASNTVQERRLPLTLDGWGRPSSLRLDRLWTHLEDASSFREAAMRPSSASFDDDEPGIACVGSGWSSRRLLLVVSFAFMSGILGAVCMAYYEEMGYHTHAAPEEVRELLWAERAEWVTIPTGCAIEEVIRPGNSEAVNRDVCTVDISYLQPWLPHVRIPQRAYCTTDPSDVKQRLPLCDELLGRPCSAIKVGVSYDALCAVQKDRSSSTNPHTVRLVAKGSHAQARTRAALDVALEVYHGPLGWNSAVRLFVFSVVLFLLLIFAGTCNVWAYKFRRWRRGGSLCL